MHDTSLPVFHFRGKKATDITEEQIPVLLAEYQDMVRRFYAMSAKLAEFSGWLLIEPISLHFDRF